MKCNDNKIDRIAIKQAGIAQNCGEYEYYITLGGKAVAQHGMACKRFDGHWEVLSE
jgi:surface antigen